MKFSMNNNLIILKPRERERNSKLSFEAKLNK